ncbi:hypothetical protein BJV82DRAFT_587493 [Fennellomyces sp. T-0311]|nr:hypothetical protein BJV82DRAFT_587493 [Fennellomyces sp. T-0311]
MYYPKNNTPPSHTTPSSIAQQQDPSIPNWLSPQPPQPPQPLPPPKQSAPYSYDLNQFPQEQAPLLYDTRQYGYNNGLQQESSRYYDGWWPATKQPYEQNEVVPQMPPPPDMQRYDLSPRMNNNSQRFEFSPTPTFLSEDDLHHTGYGVQLEFDGDLGLMQFDWTPDELAHKRRLVQFWRKEHNNKIVCGFQPVSQESHRGQVNQIHGFCIVSCIFWESQQQYCMTSVDMIRLLEFLMDIRLSMEEKNRIRRNLEGFKPVTASKNRPQTQYFFRLIMNFPNPKPRNIEKDIKVFHWRTIPTALKKIVTKYRTSVLHPMPQ